MGGAGSIDELLRRIDGRGYRAYKDLEGAHDLGAATLFVDHVQGDPFAAPSRVRLRVPRSVACLPESLFDSPIRRIGFEDLLSRRVAEAIHRVCRPGRGSGKSGEVAIDAGRQQVLERTAVSLAPDHVEARLYVGLPAAGRRVLGREASTILTGDLPTIAEQALHASSLDEDRARTFVECVENQEHLRAGLAGQELVAFVADGSLLPRRSGASDLPLDARSAIPFRSPESLRVRLPLKHPVTWNGERREYLRGLGIPEGVTLIVGGGYHGKSTLLHALEHGVYPHVPGDGREYVVTRSDAVKIRAEDGRSVASVDLRPFITGLPLGRDTTRFGTDDASGSTSQAANILEALEVGSRTLLVDEDTSATNFMVRDARMQALVHREHEPITPFVDRVRELRRRERVSTVLVMGGCGDYFDVADTVIMMRDYAPLDVTDEARRIADDTPTGRRAETDAEVSWIGSRVPLPSSFDPSRGRRSVKIDARTLDEIRFGDETIDLRGVEQIVDPSQTRAIGHAIWLGCEQMMNDETDLARIVAGVDALIETGGLDVLSPAGRRGRHPGSLARPRKYEIAAAINRLRTLQVK